MCANIQAKPKNLTKNWFLVWNSENKCWNKNQYPRDTMCVNFQAKRTTLIFLAQICPKANLKFEIKKNDVGIRISILEIPFVPIFRQNAQLWFFWSKFAQKWILGLKFQKINVGIRISILEIPCVSIFRQNEQLWIFEVKFAQKWILGVWIHNQHHQHTLWANFQSKWATLNFSTKNWGNCSITCDILVRILLGVLQRTGWRWMELGGGGCTV